jgi:hypothetical protein
MRYIAAYLVVVWLLWLATRAVHRFNRRRYGDDRDTSSALQLATYRRADRVSDLELRP